MPDNYQESITELRERALTGGIESLTNEDLLILLLHTGRDTQDISEIVDTLLSLHDNLQTLANTPLHDLMSIPGIGISRALRLKVAFALSERITAIKVTERPIIRRPSDAVELVQHSLSKLQQEHLQVVLLNAHNRVIDIETVYIGSLNATVIRVAEIFRSSIIRNCAGIILIHNHPSGNAVPSPEDITLTKDLVAAGKMLDIAVLDHLIIGDGEWVSLRERGIGFQSSDIPTISST
jgi:DNA repair protein RadC